MPRIITNAHALVGSADKVGTYTDDNGGVYVFLESTDGRVTLSGTPANLLDLLDRMTLAVGHEVAEQTRQREAAQGAALAEALRNVDPDEWDAHKIAAGEATP